MDKASLKSFSISKLVLMFQIAENPGHRKMCYFSDLLNKFQITLPQIEVDFPFLPPKQFPPVFFYRRTFILSENDKKKSFFSKLSAFKSISKLKNIFN